MKRSDGVTLILLATVGTAAVVLSQVDPSQKEDEVVTYANEAECARLPGRSPDECKAAATEAQEAHLKTAPRYEALADCEAEHGAGRCESGSRAGAPSHFVPAMLGFMLARNIAQGQLGARPLYGAGLVPPPPPPREQQQGGGGGGSSWASAGRGAYKTAAGNMFDSPGAAGSTRVPASELRTPPTRPRIVSRGGLGSTGRSASVSSGT